MDLLKFKKEHTTESEWRFDVELIEKISEATRKTEYFVGMEEVESVLLILCDGKTVPDTESKCNKHVVSHNEVAFCYPPNILHCKLEIYPDYDCNKCKWKAK